MAVLALAVFMPLVAAIETHDLAADLAYRRVHSFADSAPAIETELGAAKPLVLDLRYATASEADGKSLRGWLEKRSDAQPTYILVSPATPPALADAMASLPPGSTTLGVPGSRPKPTVEVKQGADTDRRAYDAAESEMPLTALISGRIDKERFDEAALVREFRNGSAVPPAPATAKSTEKEKAPILTDRVLQRAVHIHRALRAIKPRG